MNTSFADCCNIPSHIETIIPGSRVISTRVPDIRSMNESDFADATQSAYERVFGQIQNEQPNVIRIWNFIPGIHDSMDEGRDRYMAFNAGRFRAMKEFFGGADHVLKFAPAATGVGWDGNDLIIHALVHRSVGKMFQNPHQIPPVKYSSRFGPLPPSFARATAVGNQLLVSGTAAISGEESQHVGELALQWDLSIRHIARLISSWSKNVDAEPIRVVRDVRIYLPDQSLNDQILSASDRTFRQGTRVEIVRADLCRRELLVEIEVIAEEMR